MEISGELRFRNEKVFIWNGNKEVSLFVWLASFGLKDKDVKITVKRIKEDGKV